MCYDTGMDIYDEYIIKKTPYTASVHEPCRLKHRHLFFELVFCVRGNCTQVINDKPLKFQRGVCTILRPDDCHYFRNLPEHPYRDYLHKDIYVETDRFASICAFLRPGLYDEIVSAETAPVYQIPDECVSIQNRKLDLFTTETDPAFLMALHTSVVTELLGFYLYNDMLTKKHLPKWLTELLYDLHSPEVMTLSVTEIAGRIGYSLEHLSREFKKYMNKPLVQYLTELKIAYSMQLLKSRQMKIIDIAQLLGYENPSTFSLHFKSIHQCTPREYLKSLDSQ